MLVDGDVRMAALHCAGCHYWRTIGKSECCHYLLVEGHSRGCGITDCNRRKPYDAELVKEENRALAQLNYGSQYEQNNFAS